MALPSQFFDPFFNGYNSNKPPSPHDKALFSARPVGASAGDDWKGEPSVMDGDMHVLTAVPIDTLSVKGQGTISVQADVQGLLRFTVLTDLDGGPALHLDISLSEVLLYSDGPAGQVKYPFQVVKTYEAGTIKKGVQTTYWLSVDANNGVIRYGKHFTNLSMTLFEARLKQIKDGVPEWINPERDSWLASLKTAQVFRDNSEEQLLTIIHPMPVVIDLSPFVVSGDKLTLRDIESGAFTSPANLPGACQKLYGNIAGKEILLNDDDFPQFSDAIQRSCITKGLWAYEMLEKKRSEFGDDIKGTYLRITLGYNLGDSPGIPYVLEIWPAGHFSPIHDHGNSCAVIKVLHGEITCTWYNTLTDPTIVINKGRLVKNQITWIGPDNYQIHKLHNDSKSVCCTIQCYRYADEDNVHYDGFNWRDAEGKVHKFIPNSDMSFIDFREKMQEEWAAFGGGS